MLIFLMLKSRACHSLISFFVQHLAIPQIPLPLPKHWVGGLAPVHCCCTCTPLLVTSTYYMGLLSPTIAKFLCELSTRFTAFSTPTAEPLASPLPMIFVYGTRRFMRFVYTHSFWLKFLHNFNSKVQPLFSFIPTDDIFYMYTRYYASLHTVPTYLESEN